MKARFSSVLAVLLAGLLLAGTASAHSIITDGVVCLNPVLNHMEMDSDDVASCWDAGTGNIGHGGDPFVGGPWQIVTKSDDPSPLFNFGYTQTGQTSTESSGSWSLDPSFWNSYTDAAIGFKFGTGGNADEWFIYILNAGVTGGSWFFHNVGGQGGGLSHMVLYGQGVSVPEPSTLALLGAGLLGFGVFRRFRKS
jgi:hypothetical protein